MDKLNELLKRLVIAADNMPIENLTPEEYCAKSEAHKEWYNTFSELREYVKELPA